MSVYTWLGGVPMVDRSLVTAVTTSFDLADSPTPTVVVSFTGGPKDGQSIRLPFFLCEKGASLEQRCRDASWMTLVLLESLGAEGEVYRAVFHGDVYGALVRAGHQL